MTLKEFCLFGLAVGVVLIALMGVSTLIGVCIGVGHLAYVWTIS